MPTPFADKYPRKRIIDELRRKTDAVFDSAGVADDSPMRDEALELITAYVDSQGSSLWHADRSCGIGSLRMAQGLWRIKTDLAGLTYLNFSTFGGWPHPGQSHHISVQRRDKQVTSSIVAAKVDPQAAQELMTALVEADEAYRDLLARVLTEKCGCVDEGVATPSYKERPLPR